VPHGVPGVSVINRYGSQFFDDFTVLTYASHSDFWTTIIGRLGVDVAIRHEATRAALFFNTVECNDIDFNNDCSVFDPSDIDAFLSVFSEGSCQL